MRKDLLIAAALCLATTGMAQTVSQPLDAVTGENIHEASEAASVYWQFTADKDYIATIGQYGECDVPSLAIKGEDGATTLIDGVTASDYVTKIFVLQKGKTYYFILNAPKGKVGFNLQLDETQNVGVGLSEDNPLEIKLGDTQIFGDPCYKNGSWDDVNVYSTYKAEKSGQLRIKTTQYVSTAIVDGERVSYETENGQKVFKINTEAGKTYKINFSIGIPFFVATTEVVEVTKGALDMPYNLNQGECTIPAAAGKYFYTYKPSEKGFLNIASAATSEGAQVSVYMNKLNASSGVNAKGKSEVGSYNVKTEISSTYYTYYIVVDKKNATAADETFTCEMEGYKPGQTFDTAIPVEITEANPTPSITLEDAKGTFYYTIKVPADTKKMLLVESATELSSGTKAYVNTSTGTWGATMMEGKTIKKDVANTMEKSYYFIVESNETSPLSFTFSYVDSEKGSLASNPKDAVAGENTIDFDGAEYYTYKATRNGKLAVEVGEGVTVKFPVEASGWEMNDTYHKGNVFFIDAKQGEEYFINISGVKAGSTFTLAETDFGAGEVRATAIKMDADTYTLGEETGNLWLEYDVTKTGVVELSCDVPFDYEYSLGIAKNNNDAVTSMVNSNYMYQRSFEAVFPVKEGDKLFVQINMPGDVQGKTITLTQRDSKPGETKENPLILKKGETVDLTVAGSTKPLWIQPEKTEGERTFIVYDGSCVPVSNCRLSGDGINYDGSTVVWGDDVTMPDGSFGSKLLINEYIMVNSVEGEAKLLFFDEATTGITGIEGTADSNATIYTLDGTKVDQISGSGVYVIKSNGTTKKVFIKK